MASLAFDLHTAGVLAPGLHTLAQLRAACIAQRMPDAQAPPNLPAPARLPANERRRATGVVRLALACIEQALQDSPFPPASLRSVFASDEGTGDVCRHMLEALSTSREVSPLLFSNSVHNAAAGCFGIAWHNRQSSTVISAGRESVAAGLVCAVTEAQLTRRPVLFVAYDPPMAPPTDEWLAITDATATAWVLSAPARSAPAPGLGTFRLGIAAAGRAGPTPRPAWMPADWADNSSADALAVLGLLEASADAVCRLPLGGQVLTVQRLGEAGA